MTSVVRPLEIFTKAGRAYRNSCVWLGTCSSINGERPCWQWIWNGAEHRVANDNGAVAMEHRVRTAELQTPTSIAGNLNSIGELTKKFYRDRQCLFAQETQENRTDLIACLDLLHREKAHPPTLILGGLSGRLDHALATLHSLVQAHTLDLPIYVLDGDNLVCCLQKGEHRFALERAHLTDVCGIIPICQEETRVSTRGFRWNLDNHSLSFGNLISTSNELASDEITVKTNAPVILTFELLSSITGLDSPPK